MDDLEALYARHHADVRRFALFLTGDPAEADDLVSETFIRAWSARGRIQASSVRAYLLAITRNLHRDHHRYRRRFVPLDDTLVATRDDIEHSADPALRLQGVRRVLATASPGDRRALLMHAVGWSYREIAAHLGVTLGAVKSRIFRARALLDTLRARAPQEPRHDRVP